MAKGLLLRALIAVVLGAACAPRTSAEPIAPVGVATTTAAVPPPDATDPTIRSVRVLARGTTWALATDHAFVYYGDAGQNVLAVVPKAGGPAETIAGGAPWSVALGPRSIVWIGSPGNRVLRAPLPWSASLPADSVQLVHEGGTFTAVAAAGDDVYVTEAHGEGGALVAISEGRASRLAELRSVPRAVAVDGDAVFVQTDGGVYRVPRGGGARVRVVAGLAASRLAVDDDSVYTTLALGPTRALVRAPKSGGVLSVIEHGVRDAPIAVFGPSIFYLDADQPTVRVASKDGGASTLVMRAPALARVNALAVDETGIYAGTEGEGGGVVAIPLPLVEAAPTALGDSQLVAPNGYEPEIVGPFVPAGVRFPALVLDDLDAQGDVALDDPWVVRASVRENLRARDGTVVVRKGAILHGAVRRSGRGEALVTFSHVRLLEGDVLVAGRLVGGARLSPGEFLVVELTRPLVPPGSRYR